MSNLNDRFCFYLRAQLALSEHTVAAYSFALRDFEQWLGSNPLQAKRAQLYAFMAERMRTISANSVGPRLSALRTFYRFALDEELIRRDPTRHMRGPKRPHKLPTGATTHEEITKMLAAAGTSAQGLRDRVILLLGYDAGLRESEMTSLQMDAVLLDDNVLRVRAGKGNKYASLPLISSLSQAIREYLKDGRPQLLKGRESPFLLIDRNGTQMSRMAIFNRVRSVAQLALGKSMSPHKLRAGFCTALDRGHMDLLMVKTLMRHSDLSSTQRYLQPDAEQLKREFYSNFPRARACDENH